MTIYTIKLSKKKIVACILIAAIIVAAIIIALPGREAAGENSVTQSAASATMAIKSEQDCVDFIRSLGYEVAPQASDSRKVTIPKAFDEIYTKYNEIQLQNGFDLEKYCGKGVTLSTYQVINYQGYDDVLIDVLVYKNKVIGGAVYTAAIDGFMHGLSPNPTV